MKHHTSTHACIRRASMAASTAAAARPGSFCCSLSYKCGGVFKSTADRLQKTDYTASSELVTLPSSKGPCTHVRRETPITYSCHTKP